MNAVLRSAPPKHTFVTMGSPPGTGTIARYPLNVLDYLPLHRAALINLDCWITDGIEPRPIPPALLAFYLEESGFGQLETRRFAPATEATPALASLPEDLRTALFGAQDYAVIGRRLA